MRSLFAVFVWVLSFGVGRELQAQDLSGQWTGTASDVGSDSKQKIVLTITEGDSAIAGVLHWYTPETQYIRHLIISGRFYGKDSVLTIREDSTAGAGFHVLYYRRTPGRRDMLEGHWEGSVDPRKEAGSLTIQLEKKAPPFIPVPPIKKKKDSVQLRILQGRESPVVATIPVRGTDTVRVALYD